MPTSSFDYTEKSIEDLSPDGKELYEKAVSVLQFSHAPYSNFNVASVVRLSNGEIVSGTNQENAAYPAGLCAERVALFAARGSSKLDIIQILVIARNHAGQRSDAFPCGICRQVMLEYASLQKMPIGILMGRKNQSFIEIENVKDLLPFHFDSSTLK